MAHSTWVLLERSKLPTVSALADAISVSDYPMTIDKDWQWDTHEGWLPASWNDEDAGFEIDLEPLDEAQRAEMKKAGYSETDVAVVVTTRGWNSLKSGTAFVSTLTRLGGGCVSEEEDVFLPHSEMASWARTIIDEAEKIQQQETEKEAAVAASRAAGDFDQQLAAAIESFAGQTVSLSATAGLLILRTSENNRISSFCWKLRIGDTTYDHTQDRKLQARQIAILNEAAELPDFEFGKLPGELGEEMSELLERREVLSEQEEQTEIQASLALESLTKPVTVASVARPTKTTLLVRLDERSDVTLEFIGEDRAMMLSVTVEPLTFEFGETPEIR